MHPFPLAPLFLRLHPLFVVAPPYPLAVAPPCTPLFVQLHPSSYPLATLFFIQLHPSLPRSTSLHTVAPLLPPCTPFFIQLHPSLHSVASLLERRTLLLLLLLLPGGPRRRPLLFLLRAQQRCLDDMVGELDFPVQSSASAPPLNPAPIGGSSMGRGSWGAVDRGNPAALL